MSSVFNIFRLRVAMLTLILCCMFIVVAWCKDEAVLGPGDNVCMKKRSVVRYYTATQPYAVPMYKPYLIPCNKWSKTMCSSYKTFYKRSYRQVKLSKLDVETFYDCCHGWQKDHKSNQCNIPICSKPCRNDGICTKPDLCLCKQGWTGRDCGEDINECARENGGCSQICVNTYGSYNCTCLDGYIAKGKDCEVCLRCSKEWKAMEKKLRRLEKELTILRKQMISFKGIRMSHGVQDVEALRGPIGPKGDKGEKGQRGSPGPPVEVLTSVIGRLAHFEEYIQRCQCVEKQKKQEKEINVKEHAVPINLG